MCVCVCVLCLYIYMCLCLCLCLCLSIYIRLGTQVNSTVGAFLGVLVGEGASGVDGATVYLHMDDGQVMYCVPPYGAICVYLHVYRHVVLVCTAYGATVCASMCTSICTSIWCYCVNLNLVLLCTCIWMMVR
jgi:hypothetical protein